MKINRPGRDVPKGISVKDLLCVHRIDVSKSVLD